METLTIIFSKSLKTSFSESSFSPVSEATEERSLLPNAIFRWWRGGLSFLLPGILMLANFSSYEERENSKQVNIFSCINTYLVPKTKKNTGQSHRHWFIQWQTNRSFKVKSIVYKFWKGSSRNPIKRQKGNHTTSRVFQILKVTNFYIKDSDCQMTCFIDEQTERFSKSQVS